MDINKLDTIVTDLSTVLNESNSPFCCRSCNNAVTVIIMIILFPLLQTWSRELIIYTKLHFCQYWKNIVPWGLKSTSLVLKFLVLTTMTLFSMIYIMKFLIATLHALSNIMWIFIQSLWVTIQNEHFYLLRVHPQHEVGMQFGIQQLKCFLLRNLNILTWDTLYNIIIICC